MSDKSKNVIQISIILILLMGVGYLGFKVLSFKEVKSTVSSETTTNNAPTESNNPLDPSPTIRENAISADSEEAEACTTSDECTVISDKQRKSGKVTTNIQCLNKTYLDKCADCSTSADLVAESAKEASCTCVKNYCQFELFTQ